MIRIIIYLMLLFGSEIIYAQQTKSSVKIARLKYSGGGDWYNDQTAEVNLLQYIKRNTNINVEPKYEFVDLRNDNLFSYPIVFMTGHGNVNFSVEEVKNLKNYIENGGFLFIDDDYGLNKYIKDEIKKVFPDNDFVELPFDHPIFSSHFKFPNGTPKIHEHDNKTPKSFGIFIENRLAIFYTEESNPSDGWVEPEIHNNPPEKREEALKFGTNVIIYALTN